MSPDATINNWRAVLKALDVLLEKGEPFTMEQVWDIVDDVPPAAFRNRLGRHTQELQKAGRIQCVGWRETTRSLKHSRTARVWQPVAAGDRLAALENAAVG